MRTGYLDYMFTAESLPFSENTKHKGSEVLCYIQRQTVYLHLNQIINIFPILVYLKEKTIIISFCSYSIVPVLRFFLHLALLVNYIFAFSLLTCQIVINSSSGNEKLLTFFVDFIFFPRETDLYGHTALTVVSHTNVIIQARARQQTRQTTEFYFSSSCVPLSHNYYLYYLICNTFHVS